jgi:dolichol-phosphate mannosyltransferase
MHHDNGFSIIVPTFNEVKNIRPLVSRIAAIDFAHSPYEVLLMDDNSQDGTVAMVNSLTEQYPWLKLHVRYVNPSLSAAVMDGITLAQYPHLIIMDADLSHPPEIIPDMLRILQDSSVDLVIGSRYVKDGSTDVHWPWHRKIASQSAAFMARMVVPAHIKDPLSGFLAIKKSKCIQASLQPLGWKISLEIMVKCQCKNIIELPIHFVDRQRGSSKMNVKVFYHYIRHLNRLFFYKLWS